VNRELPREWFSPPQFTRTLLQDFLEHLYYERSDTSALRWTYSAFRRAHPEADTRTGIDFVGYQMLKMGDHLGGIVVLAMNAEDYPQSSTSAFGLGRAYNAAGDTVRARQAFERALRLDPDNKRAADALALLRRP
jgi:Flp pilus assembly protein TadD